MAFSFYLPFKELPENNPQRNHAEAKKKVLQRYAAGPYAKEKLAVIYNYAESGKVTVYQEFKA
ncbi:MAG: hypothetical protein WC357_03950 [Candidatus Omnitrophota bacterium]|jgi:hypothetical protein